MFRAERPQAGRYREFWQIGAEYFGNASPVADAELLLLVQTLFRELGLKDARLKINSLGDAKCRPKYLEALTAYIKGVKNLCDDCQERVKKNPLRVLDCKVDGPRLTDVPTIDAFWDADCRTHFETVQDLLKASGGDFEVVPKLVRGLDYYTRTVFEVTSSALGAQDAMAAGGRYDKLVKDLDGPDVPALGFAMGMERAILAIEAVKKQSPAAASNGTTVFVAAMGDAASREAFQLLQQLRVNPKLSKLTFEGGFFEKKLGAQLTIADRVGAQHAIILGDDEVKTGQVTFKSFQASSQKTIEKSALITHLLSLDAEKPLD